MHMQCAFRQENATLCWHAIGSAREIPYCLKWRQYSRGYPLIPPVATFA